MGPRKKFPTTPLWMHEGVMKPSMRDWRSSSDKIVASRQVASEKLGPSQEDLRAEEMLQESCIDIGGRYQYSLLWKYDREMTAKMMPTYDSKVMARQRTLKSVQRLKGNQVLKKKVEDTVQEFLDKARQRWSMIRLFVKTLHGTCRLSLWNTKERISQDIVIMRVLNVVV